MDVFLQRTDIRVTTAPTYRYGDIMRNVSINLQLPPNPRVRVNRLEFLRRLRLAMSTTQLEKSVIIRTFATFDQRKVDELMLLWVRDIGYWDGLASSHASHAENIRKCEQRLLREWQEIERKLRHCPVPRPKPKQPPKLPPPAKVEEPPKPDDSLEWLVNGLAMLGLVLIVFIVGIVIAATH